MQLLDTYNLQAYNTFGISVYAQQFARAQNLDAWKELLTYAHSKKETLLVLGGGSNVLFTQDVKGICVKNELMGISLLREDAEFVYIKVGAGENWHQFVMHCVANGYAGVENLSLIPGSVGAGPMQNIGAYGVELKDVFYELTALHRESFDTHVFSLADCAFDYRSSVFKTIYKNQFIITDVTFRLRKNPVFAISYGAIEEELQKAGVQELGIKAISDAVIRIRQSKLPDPKEIGNAGSFFKNPSVRSEHYSALKEKYPTLPGYPSTVEGHTKIAAGWLIEQCGWKGYRQGDFGVHKNQALVLVNYGKASGNDIYKLSEEIIHSVNDKFGIELEREVNVY